MIPPTRSRPPAADPEMPTKRPDVDAVAVVAVLNAGAVVSIIGPGRCTIDANQGGNASYSAAPQVAQTFIVGEPSPVITSADNATGTTGSSFSFVVTTISASVPTITKKGKTPLETHHLRQQRRRHRHHLRDSRDDRHLRFTIQGHGSGRGRTKSVATQLFTLTIGSPIETGASPAGPAARGVEAAGRPEGEPEPSATTRVVSVK